MLRLFPKAKSALSKGDYEEALRLYEAAGERYGFHVVEAQIELCLEAIDRSTESSGPSLESEHLRTLSKWPDDLCLAPLPESTNDFEWAYSRHTNSPPSSCPAGLSVVIPTFNRPEILDITLACLVNQVTAHAFEVIVADDGSSTDLTTVVRSYEKDLDIKYVRQMDLGYRLSAVRNLGLRAARFECVAILDCDMAPNPNWIQCYMELLSKSADVALIGPRKYVDTSGMSGNQFIENPALLESIPEIVTNNSVAGQLSENISIDWRLAHFAETQNLRLCNVPFRFFSGGNVALNRKWLDRVGGFDEAFNAWGGEDIEFAYRLYRAGCFFRAVDGGLAYHQEPPGKENETDREEGKRITQPLVRSKVHFSYRRPLPGAPEDTTQNPLVSIYIPAYNCEEFIEKCVESALSQSITDLEVCVCDDGSTDNTWAILQQHYGSHPRVNIMRKDNGGIGSASNAAVRMCRGHYIGQLDADDFLECDAVEACLNEFLADFNLACVYTTYRNVDTQGKLIADGYNWPEFSREKFTTAMIVHHFRMFTARAWNLTEGFHEHIINAVDYDMYLKLSEVGPFKHVNRICYNRTLHGENTSVRKIREQKKNHFRVVNESLERQGIEDWRIVPADPGDDASRTLLFAPRSGTAGVLGASG